jgi:hypothetical protein
MKNRNWKRLAVKGLITILVVGGLALLAHVLVNSFNIVELIKRFHGG